MGIRFWTGDTKGLLEEVDRSGGLLTVPSAPSLAEVGTDELLKKSYQGSDWAVVDGGYIALIIRLVFQRSIPRISGLQILQKLLGSGAKREIPMEQRKILWVMPDEAEAQRVSKFTAELGLPAENQSTYLAPFYRKDEDYRDGELLDMIHATQPDWIILGIGGGRQEKLGLFLRDDLRHDTPSFYRDKLPVILCTGGAIAFLTGGQVNIPTWADRLYLGWLFRVMSDPKRFVSRYWKAAWCLPWVLWCSRGDLFGESPATTTPAIAAAVAQEEKEAVAA